MTTPVLSVYVGRRNDGLISEASRLWIGPDDEVLDLTYGLGRFWTKHRPAQLVTNDRYTPADMGVDYRRPPIWLVDWCDVVVFDPPYISTGASATSTIPDFYRRFGLHHGNRERRGWQKVEHDMRAGISSSARALRPGGRLLVKCCDYVDGGRRRWGHQWVVDAATQAGLEQVDEFIHHSGTGAQPSTNLDGTPRRQVHSRRAHSFLCVFQKPPVATHSTR